MDHSKRT